MADDQAPDRFTDDELVFLRHVRFGELPPRVRPDELVESIETDPGRDTPDLDPKPYNTIRGSAG
jgi:hypothetical protein